MLLFVCIAVVVLLLFEAPRLYVRRKKKAVVVFVLMLSLVTVLAYNFEYRLPFPAPVRGIEAVFKPQTSWME
ncbi:hypothetical protein [Paenibacillus sp. 2TAB19]